VAISQANPPALSLGAEALFSWTGPSTNSRLAVAERVAKRSQKQERLGVYQYDQGRLRHFPTPTSAAQPITTLCQRAYSFPPRHAKNGACLSDFTTDMISKLSKGRFFSPRISFLGIKTNLYQSLNWWSLNLKEIWISVWAWFYVPQTTSNPHD